PRQVAGIGRTQKPESVRQHLQRSIAEDALALFRLVLEQCENEVVLAQTVRAVDLVGVGDFDEFRDRLGLEVGQVHRWTGGRGEAGAALLAASIALGGWRRETLKRR